MNKYIWGVIAISLIILVVIFFLRHSSSPSTLTASPSVKTIHIVAAENFYGDIVKQLGGDHVLVTSILSDPNVDPHEYESNVQDGVAISQAQIVIKNGLEYDTWMDKLLAASPNQSRTVITGGDIAPHKLPDNPHVWYGLENMPAIAESITVALKAHDPQDASAFDQNLVTFKNSLQPIQQKMDEVKSKYGNTPIGLTETIALYQTQQMGLNVLTPFEFEKAIAEGNDPPANSVQVTNTQISGKQVKVLIFNSQTVTPITTHLQQTAQQLNMPIVPVSETLPPNQTYQTWMLSQLQALETALQQAVQ